MAPPQSGNIGDLARKTEDEIIKVRNLGRKPFEEVVRIMNEYGLKFADENI